MTAKAILLRERSSEAQPPGRFVLCVLWMPLTLQRGNDGQPPWFEHDQILSLRKSCCDAPGLTRQRKRPSFASAGYDGSGLYGEGEKVFCVMCDEDYEGEKCCPRCGTGYTAGRGGCRKATGRIGTERSVAEISCRAVMISPGVLRWRGIPG